MTILGVICAREGSKRLPGKHLRLVGGKPMIEWTFEAAKAWAGLGEIKLVVSTDDEQVIRLADEANILAIERPKELATDDAPIELAVLHALDQMGEFDHVVLLQATSPLRTAQDIDATVKLCKRKAVPAAISVCEPGKKPYWLLRVIDGGMVPEFGFKAIKDNHDLPPLYIPNGAVFVAQVEWFRDNRTFYNLHTAAYVMPRARSIDVDDELDLILADALASKRPEHMKQNMARASQWLDI
jgi:N-acylneuraminate cytidylyltransferase